MAEQKDPFGIIAESRIAKSGIRNIFTPHTPVNSIDLFLGRTFEVKGINAQINTPGQHSLLFGDRGVGKSSLAKIFAELIFNSGPVKGKLYQHRCSSDSKFEHMLLAPLRDVGVDLKITEVNEEHQGEKGAQVGTSFFGATASAGAKSTKKSSTKTTPILGPLLPSTAAELLSNQQALLVIDELDAVSNPQEKLKLAEFIKQLSDMSSKFKILAVGIAQTADELTKGHPSVERCLKETKLRILDDAELEKIIATGSKKAGIIFEGDVIRKIVQLSGGYPHFTHLISLKCAEILIEADANSVSKQILDKALIGAASDAEATLRNSYDKVTITHNKDSSETYVNILCAAAVIPDPEFTAERLRASYKVRCGKSITQQALNNYFKRLAPDNGGAVLTRKAKGVYAFADPRMACYIRIKNKLL